MKEYERLTYRSGNAICIKETSTNDNKSIWNAIERLAELEDKLERGELVENAVVTYVNMGRSNSKTLIDKALKFDELKAKIENGTLIELPCKVGDTAYYVVKHENDYVIEKGLVKGISVEVNDIWIYCHYKSGLNYWHKYKENYDKLFFNYAEAEAKLKELKEEV